MMIASKVSGRFAQYLFISAFFLILCATTSTRAFSQTKVVLNQTTDGTPAAAVYNGVVYLAWTGTDTRLNVAESTDGLHFSAPVTLSDTSFATAAGPALAAFNGYLWLAWTGGSNYINLENSTGGLSFGNKVVHSDMLSATTPAIGAEGSDLYVAYTDLNSYLNTSNPLVTAFSADGVNFSQPIPHNCESMVENPYNHYVDSPTLSSAPFGSAQVIWFAATISPNPCGKNPSNYVTFHTGVEAGIGNEINNGGVTSTGGAGVTSLGSNVYLAWVPEFTGGITLNVYNGNPPNGPVTLVSSTSTGQQLVGNPVLLTYNGHVFMYWAGTDAGHHINAEQIQ